MKKRIRFYSTLIIIVFILSQITIPIIFNDSAIPKAFAEDALPDSQPPSQPANLKIVLKTDTAITLAWDVSDDNIGVTEYEVFNDSTMITTSTTNSCAINNLSPSTTYNFTVKAKDAAGNISNASNLISATTDIAADTSSPTLPSNLTIVSKTATSVTLQWNASTDNIGVTEYQILNNSDIIATSTTNSATINGLTPSITYNLTVKAKDAAGNTSEASNLVNVTTNAADTSSPTQPANLVLNSRTDTTINIKWDASSDDSGAVVYEIYNGTSLLTTSVSNSCTVTGLAPASTYNISVKAKDAAGNTSAACDALSVTTLPSIPVNISLQPSTTSICLSWSPVANASGYEVEVDGNAVDAGLQTSFTKSNLLSNTEHTFKVRSKFGTETSNWSDETKAKTKVLDVPSNINISKTLTSIIITWNSVSEASEYEVEADGIIVSNLVDTSYTQKGLIPNSQHSYKIRAKNTGGSSEWSPQINAKADMMNIPSNIAMVSSTNKITVTWSSTVDATGYDIEADGIIIDNSTNTSFTDDQLNPNTQHKYRVRARYGANLGDWSSLITTFTSPDIPININTIADGTSIRITWSSVSGATSYDIEVDGIVSNIIGTSYTHSGLEQNSTHKYRIKSKNSSGNSDWSNLITETVLSNTSFSQDLTDGLSTSAFTASNQSSLASRAFNNTWNESNSGWVTTAGTYTNSWLAVDFGAAKEVVHMLYQADAWNSDYRGGMKNFRVEYSDNNSNWASGYTGTALQNGNKQEYTWASIGSHRYWRLFVEDCYNSSCIAISEIEFNSKLSPGLAIPTNITTSNITGTSIALSWSTVNEATAYDVEVDGIVISNITTPNYISSGLTSNTQHKFRIRSKNYSQISNWSLPIVQNTLLTAPFNISNASTSTTITLSWSALPNISGYDVEVDGTVVDNGTNTVYKHSGLSPNTQHKYRVRTRLDSTISDWSSLITTYTAPSTPQNINAVALDNTITLSWTAVTGATGYDIEADNLIVGSTSTTSFIQYNLIQNSSHTYRVRAKSNNGISDWSVPVTKATANINYSQDLTDTLSSTAFTASSQLSTNYSATNAFNNIWNENGTGWTTPYGTYRNSWILATFNTAKPIVRMIYQADACGGDYRGGIKNFYIQYSDNYSTWTTAYTGLALQNGNRQEFVWANAGSHIYWRVYVVDSYNTSYIAISEMEFEVNLTSGFTIPQNVTTSNVKGTSITVNWTAVAGATAYDIEADGVIISNIKDTTYTHNGLIERTQHSYRVRAKNDIQISDWTNPTVQHTLWGTSDKVTTSSTGDTITVSWIPVDNAIGYDIEIDGIVVDNGVNTTYSHTGLVVGTKHTYRVRGKFNNEEGDWCDLITTYTLPETPIGITTSGFNTFVKLVWPVVIGASAYDVEADGKVIGTTNNNTFFHNNLYQKSTHTYRVRSRNTGGVSEWSTAITITTGDINYSSDITDSLSTTAFSASYQSSTSNSVSKAFNNLWNENGAGWMTPTGIYTNSWIKIDFGINYPIVRMLYQADAWSGDYRGGMKKFRVEYSDNNSTWNTAYNGIAEQNGDKQEFVWPSAGSHRYWRIYIVDSYNTNCIAISEIGMMTTLSPGLTAPVNIATTNITQNNITISWPTVAGANAYDVEEDGVIYNDLLSAYYFNSGLEFNSEHTYRVRAKNYSQVSNWSTPIVVRTLAHKGTADDPYLISTKADLINIKKNLYACYKLINDIDLQNEEWVPIGDNSSQFTGTFDGNGYKISNVNINRSSSDYVGFFGFINKATIKNLELNNVNIIGNKYVGALVGYVYGSFSTINNCFITGMGQVRGSSYVGGMIGSIEYNNTSGTCIKKCSSQVDVINSGILTGGLIGCCADTSASIEDSCSTGNVFSSRYYVGGLIGDLRSGLNKCFATGNVTGSYNVGGLVGTYFNSSNYSISNCYATGNVSATTGVSTSEGLAGGLVGYLNLGKITNCYSSGNVSSSITGYVGGLIGKDTTSGGVSSSFFDSTITLKTVPSSQARTTVQLMSQSTFGGWNFTNIWHINEGTSYPYIILLDAPSIPTVKGITKDTISLCWNSMLGMSGYDIEVDGTVIDNGTSTTYTHPGLKPGSKHTYRVRSKNDKGTSDWGPMLTVSTLIDSPLNVRTHTDGPNIIVEWDAVEDAGGYDIEIDGVTVDNGNTTSYTHDKIQPNSQHVYRVRVKTDSTTSKWSAPASDINWSESSGVCLAAVNWVTTKSSSDDIQLLIKTNNLTDLYTAFIEIQYDPQNVQIDESSISNLIWTDTEGVYKVIQNDSSNGKIKLLLSGTGKFKYDENKFDILSFKIKLKSGTGSQIKVNIAKFVDSSGGYINVPEIVPLNIIILQDE